jgi:general secretion pathway protein A
LCDLAMTYAFSAGQRRVRRATVVQVIDDGVFFAGGGAVAPRLAGKGQ